MTTPDSTAPSEQPAPLLAPERTVSLPPSSHLGYDDVPAPGSARVRRTVGWVLSGLVLIFAFLAASFAARNGDLWLHLATGRLLAQGQYQIGVDPFAYTTDKVEWINHSWLFDWLLYLLYSGVGGVGLVLLKAIVVTLLASILLCVRRPNAGNAWPAACTALAILTMSPRLQLQPACVSYLFLGLTLWLLWRPHADAGNTRNPTAAGSLKYYAPLPLLCALWVNMDAWFLLGPLLIGLYWSGERLEGLFRSASREVVPQTPWWVFPASLAACLLNPHHFHAFTLPAELSALLTEAGLRSDPRLSRLFVSPWQSGIHWEPVAAINLAEWAYFVLVGWGLVSFALKLVSFVLNWNGQWGWRVLVWAAFALLGAWQVRTVPFFAVVAGPIMALNIQDFLSGLSGAPRSIHGREPAGWAPSRLGIVVVALALIAIAWPGWLQGFQRAERRVAWEVQPDPSLKRVAETIGRWRQEGLLREGDRAFPVHPDVAHYLAWYCPEEKGFFDSRFSLFHGTAAEYVEVCRGLNPALDRAAGGLTATEDAERPAGGWRQVLHKHGVTYLILYDPDLKVLLSAASALAKDPQHWTLLRIDGQVMIYGWNEGRGEPSADPFAALRFDPERLTFGLVETDQELPAAPGEGPGRAPQVRDLRAAFVEPAPQPTWESPAATLLLHHFEDTALPRRWTGFAAGLAGIAATPAKPPGAPADVLMRLRNGPLFFAESERLPALPLLAVRAARRALVADPDDANAQMRLGQAYVTLQDAGGGESLQLTFPPLAMLRHIQAVTALEQTLLLNPDLEAVHRALAVLYRQQQYLDVALEHRRAELRLTRRAGARPGETADDYTRRIFKLEKATQDLEDVVQDRQNQFAIRSQGLSAVPLEKAQMALDLSLARQALEGVLLPSNVVLFDTPGARLELSLLLMLGRAEEARTKLDDEDLRAMKKELGWFEMPFIDHTGRRQIYRLPTFEWLRACQAAATGDYDQAASALADIRELLRTEEQSNRLLFQRELSGTVTSELGLMGRPETVVFQLLIRDKRNVLVRGYGPAYAAILFLRAEQADLHVVAGVLALEQGQPAEAKRRFEEAIALFPPDAVPAGNFAGRAFAEAQVQRFPASLK